MVVLAVVVINVMKYNLSQISPELPTTDIVMCLIILNEYTMINHSALTVKKNKIKTYSSAIYYLILRFQSFFTYFFSQVKNANIRRFAFLIYLYIESSLPAPIFRKWTLDKHHVIDECLYVHVQIVSLLCPDLIDLGSALLQVQGLCGQQIPAPPCTVQQ